MRRLLLHPATGLAVLLLAVTGAVAEPQARVTLVRWPYT
jgi:hypothetical protein